MLDLEAGVQQRRQLKTRLRLIVCSTAFIGLIATATVWHQTKGEAFAPRRLDQTNSPNSTNETVPIYVAPSPPPPLLTYADQEFTEEQLRSGAIVLHVFGVLYMFLALAIVWCALPQR